MVELQKLEFGPRPESSSVKAAAEKLRAQIPEQILAHYDRLRVRGKRGAALVRHQVCTECHMSVPLGTVMTVVNGLDIELCGNCGRYLYVEPPPAAPPAPAPAAPAAKPPAKPPAKRGRKPKKKTGD